MSLNRIEIIGNLGADVDLKFSPSGLAIANMRVATQEQWKDKDGKPQKRVTWHRVVTFGPQSEKHAKYLSKGRQVHVTGRIANREYMDKDNVKRYVSEVVADRIIYLGKPAGKSENVSNRQESNDDVDMEVPV